MICPPARITGLEAAFARIQRERMADVPLLNPDLRVQAVRFNAWQQRCLGVLITPWFMNLLLLPGRGETWDELPVGSKIVHTLPSGNYEFILAREEGIGPYQMCSLFSPMFEFENQQAAVATAEAVMAGIMDEASREQISTRERDMRRIWNGEGEPPVTAGTAVDSDEKRQPDLAPRMEQAMSRRALLRGAFLRGEK